MALIRYFYDLYTEVYFYPLFGIYNTLISIVLVMAVSLLCVILKFGIVLLTVGELMMGDPAHLRSLVYI